MKILILVYLKFLSYIVKEYKKFKLKNELFDFNDLAIEVLNLFDKREDILNLYREKFKYILVDGFKIVMIYNLKF